MPDDKETVINMKRLLAVFISIQIGAQILLGGLGFFMIIVGIFVHAVCIVVQYIHALN